MLYLRQEKRSFFMDDERKNNEKKIRGEILVFRWI